MSHWIYSIQPCVSSLKFEDTPREEEETLSHRQRLERAAVSWLDRHQALDIAWLLEKLGDPAGLLSELRLVRFKNRIGTCNTYLFPSATVIF